MTLMELLVAGFISVIVASGMIILMANTLGTGTQTIKMTKLSAEMRTAMQIMTRELHRANYHKTFTTCYGDIDCLNTLSIADWVTEININDSNNCFWFYYDRPQRGASQDAITVDQIAAFRLRTVTELDGSLTGLIQMAMPTADPPSAPPEKDQCPPISVVPENEWVDITNPDLVDITEFNVTDVVPNFASYTWTVNGTQSVERIGITLSGKLKDDASLPAWMQGDTAPVLTIRDFILVRNNVLSL